MTNYQRGQRILCGDYSSYTPTGSSYFKKAGRWGTTPHAGDIIYFYTANLGRISHVGIVESAQYANGVWLIDAIEGNTAAGTNFSRDGGCVAMKHYDPTPGQIGGKNRIAGFGTPLFEADTCSVEQFLAIARSQVGYVEKASVEGLNEFRANPGDKNYTKYGQWYGMNPAQWCQMFVSWCAYMGCVSAHDYQPGWYKDGDNNWQYRKQGGDYARDEWIQDGGRWYVFDGAGHMVRGWYKDSSGDWYYMAGDGAMCSSQWVSDDKGKQYYLTASGAMARLAYVKEPRPDRSGQHFYYFVDEHGVYQKEYDTYFPHLEIYEEAK